MSIVNGVHLEQTGPDDAPAIVLLHGLASDGRFWSPLVQLLSDEYRVITVDVPGFGRSHLLGGHDDDINNEYDLHRVSHKIGEALTEFGVEQHALVGHSFGGGLSALYATEHPDRVTHLALLAPAGFLKSPGSIRRSWTDPRVGMATRLISRAGLPLLMIPKLRRMALGYHVVNVDQLSARDAITLARGAAGAREGGPAGVAIVTAGLLPLVEQLTMPTLVVWGKQDRVVDPRMAARLGKLLPDSRVVTYPNTGHALLYEPGNPQRLATDITTLLRQASAQVR